MLQAPAAVRQRFRFRFAKEGDLRMLGHRDLMRLLERVFRRAALPLAMSGGFHPHARLSLPAALAVGIAGRDELLEVILEGTQLLAPEQVLERIRAQSPPGLVFHSAEEMSPSAPKPRVGSVTLTIPVPSVRRAEVQGAVEAFLARPSYVVARESNHKQVDIRPPVAGLVLRGDELEMRLTVTPEMAVRPREILAALGISDLESLGAHITRTRVELES